jgi:hypothetical protein
MMSEPCTAGVWCGFASATSPSIPDFDYKIADLFVAMRPQPFTHSVRPQVANRPLRRPRAAGVEGGASAGRSGSESGCQAEFLQLLGTGVWHGADWHPLGTIGQESSSHRCGRRDSAELSGRSTSPLCSIRGTQLPSRSGQECTAVNLPVKLESQVSQSGKPNLPTSPSISLNLAWLLADTC